MCVVPVMVRYLLKALGTLIEPGHGSKGKQRWLASTDDLKDMFGAHQDKNYGLAIQMCQESMLIHLILMKIKSVLAMTNIWIK